MTTSFEVGFVVAMASNPINVIKTRVIKVEPGAEPPYSGALDCAFFFFEKMKIVLCTLFYFFIIIYLFMLLQKKKNPKKKNQQHILRFGLIIIKFKTLQN